MITKDGVGAKQVAKKRKKYEMVADRLRDCIENGVYKRKLPGVRVLSQELETNPMTLGSAIKLLVEDGMLYRIPKSGTYIQEKKTRQKIVWALLVSSAEAPMTSRALQRISTIANENDINLLFFNHGNDEEQELSFIKRIINEKLADGIIWWPSSQSFGIKAQDLLVEASLPFVVLEMHWIGVKGTCVAPDHFASFRDLTRHLVRQGCEKILFITNHPFSQTEPRYLAYRSVLDEEGLEIYMPYCIPNSELDPETWDPSPEVMEMLLSVDGIICQFDAYAAKLYQCLTNKGVRIPEDLMMVSFDGVEIAELLGITTYTQPIEAIGERSAKDLLAKIKNDGESSPAESVFLKGELILRKSSSKVL